MAVSAFLRTTDALGIAACEGSVMVPCSVARNSCAATLPASNNTVRIAFQDDMGFPPDGDQLYTQSLCDSSVTYYATTVPVSDVSYPARTSSLDRKSTRLNSS